MVTITMEAQAQEEEWDTLVRAFEYAMQERPDTLLLSLLTHDSLDPTLWRVITVWESEEALESYYASHDFMPSAYAFQLVNITPVATLGRIAAFV